jgi:hypothetical protein
MKPKYDILWKGMIENVLANAEFSPEKIAELVGVSIALVEKIKRELSSK